MKLLDWLKYHLAILQCDLHVIWNVLFLRLGHQRIIIKVLNEETKKPDYLRVYCRCGEVFFIWFRGEESDPLAEIIFKKIGE